MFSFLFPDISVISYLIQKYCFPEVFVFLLFLFCSSPISTPTLSLIQYLLMLKEKKSIKISRFGAGLFSRVLNNRR